MPKENACYFICVQAEVVFKIANSKTFFKKNFKQ